ncbi:MAG: hypothetical protein KBS79_03480 [Lachnospiraceae bacterium]|nr:hypothetical protein [Candidatus Minthocola equi]
MLLEELVAYFYGSDDVGILKAASYVNGAEKYLLGAGMTQQEIEELKNLISE